MELYIILGCKCDYDNAYGIISEYGIKTSLESARNELQNVYNEIVEENKKNDIQYDSIEFENDRIFVEYQEGIFEEYKIIHRNITN